MGQDGKAKTRIHTLFVAFFLTSKLAVGIRLRMYGHINSTTHPLTVGRVIKVGGHARHEGWDEGFSGHLP